ncbi:PAS domain-containing protein [Mucilaginibacter sp. dw_454]|uniref:PAS domain-containing protein n=1 Tax=Mucilaginibacter sp. dw_454 TaxID=2720079 RepID=UPI001BD2F3FC|nr:PAS domain-containing protein [Mucilaginibacter sp. dw_454]
MKPNNKFLRSVFEVAHVEFQEYDLNNHRLLFSSGVAVKILGYTADEYFALSDDFYKKIVHPDDWQKVLDTREKLVHSHNGEIVEMTIRLLRHDGNYIWAYSRQMVTERKANGDIKIIIREVEDVTYIIELEAQLKEKVGKLQTISYQNSHLVRSPVASIIGLVDIIEEHGIIGDHNVQIFEYLKQTIEKLDSVIHSINDTANN